MTTTTELTPLLKRLKLGAVLNTLPERVALARREQLDYASFLQIILTDERSTAETTGGLSSASRGPASSRPAASKTSTGPHPSHSTGDS